MSPSAQARVVSGRYLSSRPWRTRRRASRRGTRHWAVIQATAVRAPSGAQLPAASKAAAASLTMASRRARSTVERDDRLGVGQGRRVRLSQSFEHLGEVVKYHGRQSSTRV